MWLSPRARLLALCAVVSIATARDASCRSDLEVEVVQEEGLPVVVEVRVGRMGIFDELVGQTGDDGKVIFRDLAAGSYYVRVGMEFWLWQRQSTEVTVSEGSDAFLRLAVRPVADVASLVERPESFWRVRFTPRNSFTGDQGSLEIFHFETGQAVARFLRPCEAGGPEIVLDAAERDRFLALLERSRLFSGDHVGTRNTPHGGPFVTLEVVNGFTAAILLVSGNPSFEVGPRRDLRRYLDDVWLRMFSSLYRDGPEAPSSDPP